MIITLSLGMTWLESLRYKYSKSFRNKVDIFIREVKKEINKEAKNER